MKLKKINKQLQDNLLNMGFEEPTVLQKSSFGSIKGGEDTFIVAPSDQGKTLALAIAALQRVEQAQPDEIATRVLIVVKDRNSVEVLKELLENLSHRMQEVRIFAVHDNSDFDEDKNLLSLGNDILIGTPERLNEMFSSAGFDVNQLKMFAIDDVDVLLKNRFEPRLFRLSESIGKTQRLYLATQVSEMVDVFIDKTFAENYNWFDLYPEEDQ